MIRAEPLARDIFRVIALRLLVINKALTGIRDYIKF